jgi:hypothetical protein
MTPKEIEMLVTSGAYATYQTMAGGFLAGALLNPDPKAAKVCLDAYVQSQKDLGDMLRGSINGSES